MGQIGLVGQVEFVGNEEGGSQRWRRNRRLSTTLDKTIVMKCLYFFKEDTNLGRRELRRKDETLWMGGREFSW